MVKNLQIMLEIFLYFFLAKFQLNGFSETISGGLLDPGPLILRAHYNNARLVRLKVI